MRCYIQIWIVFCGAAIPRWIWIKDIICKKLPSKKTSSYTSLAVHTIKSVQLSGKFNCTFTNDVYSPTTLESYFPPTKAKCRAKGGSILGRRRRRRPTIEPTSIAAWALVWRCLDNNSTTNGESGSVTNADLDSKALHDPRTVCFTKVGMVQEKCTIMECRVCSCTGQPLISTSLTFNTWSLTKPCHM